MPKHLTLATAGEPDLAATSESEEMYVITLARAIESGGTVPVPIPVIADALPVSVASANEMVRKLATRGLMTYEPYHGVGLTEAGWTVANRVLRTRRLWATFLADQLGFTPVEADEQACHLEHATNAAAVDRLASFLGDPVTDPLGLPIPERDSSDADRVAVMALSDVAVGFDARVVAIGCSGAVLDFLSGAGIRVGAQISVVASGDAAVLVDAGSAVHVTRELAAAIDVGLIGRSDAR